MITRSTFCAVLDKMKDHYDRNSETEFDYPMPDGSILTAESAILTILSEALNDDDNLIHDWVHGLMIQDKEGGVCLEFHFDDQDKQFFRILDAGDLYDFLMVFYNPDDDVYDVKEYQEEYLAPYNCRKYDWRY